MRIWNEKYECMKRADMRALQLERLQATVARVYEKVPFYRAAFDKVGLKPSHIKSLDDLKLIPFTNKDDLRDNFPYGMFAVPMRDIVRIHASSGTTGRSTVVGYTRNDLDMWAEVVARFIVAAGGNENDIAQVSFGYSLFTGAFGLHYGLERIGAAVIPISSGNTERQIKIMQEFGSTLLVSTPSYALYMAEVAEKMGVDTKALPLRLGLFGAEGHTEKMREELERRWNITATENYGLSEIIGPGVSGECLERQGMHISDDHFITEIIDPETGEVLPEGAEGEVVLTTITKEGLPLLRYRTHDISWLTYEPCRCGRTTTRMKKIKGRSDDMLIIRGVNVFPSQIESVLLSIPEVGPHYEIVVTRRNYLDEIEVKIELADARLLERYADLEALQKRVCDKLKVVLGLDAQVTLANPSTLKRFEGKAKRVTDLRD